MLDTIRRRRSIRRYSNREIEKEKLDVLLEAARLAPSSSNTQPWRFVVVRDKPTIQALVECVPLGPARTNAWMAQAPCVIVACGKPHLLVHFLARVVDINLLRVDVAVAVEHIVLVAAELGLGTCWVGWFSEKKVKRLLGIPADVRVIALLPVGYPTDGSTSEAVGGVKARPRHRLSDIVSFDRYST